MRATVSRLWKIYRVYGGCMHGGDVTIYRYLFRFTRSQSTPSVRPATIYRSRPSLLGQPFPILFFTVLVDWCPSVTTKYVLI